jgi:TrpR-related protein YerC/YecD
MPQLAADFSEIATELARLQTQEGVFLFVRDILTEEEMQEMITRWTIAKLLADNISYTQITKMTGASSTTIARVQKFLKGSNQGYQKALQNLKAIAHPHHTDHRSRDD